MRFRFFSLHHQDSIEFFHHDGCVCVFAWFSLYLDTDSGGAAGWSEPGGASGAAAAVELARRQPSGERTVSEPPPPCTPPSMSGRRGGGGSVHRAAAASPTSPAPGTHTHTWHRPFHPGDCPRRDGSLPSRRDPKRAAQPRCRSMDTGLAQTLNSARSLGNKYTVTGPTQSTEVHATAPATGMHGKGFHNKEGTLLSSNVVSKPSASRVAGIAAAHSTGQAATNTTTHLRTRIPAVLVHKHRHRRHDPRGELVLS